MQTLARLLRQSGGRMGDPFSTFTYTSWIRPHEAYLAGLHASKHAAAAMATAIISPMHLGVEVELIAKGPGDDINALNDWAPNPDDSDSWSTRKGTQRVVVRLDDPAGRKLAEAFIGAFFGMKSIFMRSPKWKALTEWQPRSRDGNDWLARLDRKAPSLRPALRMGTPKRSWAVFSEHAIPVAARDKQQPQDLYTSALKDPLTRELNAAVTDLIPVPFTVQVSGPNGETRLVRPKGVVNDEDPDVAPNFYPA